MAKKRIVDSKTLKSAIGDEKIKDLSEKEWSVAELPSEEQISSEVHESSKARNNINSRKNLIQYRADVPPETKEKILSNLRYRTVRENRDIKAFFGGTVGDKLVDIILPMREALASSDEEDVFLGTIKHFISDFSKEDLSSSDIDDVANLALNRILELRLLKKATEDPRRLLDIAATIERFRKNSEKIKMSLASRRMDRIDTKNKGGVSIVDLVEKFDSDRRKQLQEKADKYTKEEADFEKAKASKLSIIEGVNKQENS